MESERIHVGDLKSDLPKIQSVLEDYLSNVEIAGKDARSFTLLTEEAIRFVKSIISESEQVEVWFDGNARVSHICIQARSNMDANMQEQLISVSTTGENKADHTFFDDLRSIFIKPKKPTWSLAEYEANLLLMREKDKYSEEAWENLERSVIANLADDISVGVKDDNVLMIIRKDFTKSIKDINSEKPRMKTRKLYFSNEERLIDDALNNVEDSLNELKLGRKDMLHLKLLFEEAIGMVRAMSGDFSALIWAEKYKTQCAIRLILITKMDIDKKADFISASSKKTNASAVGVMGKISDIIETGLLSYEGVMNLQQKYNGTAVNYGMMGTYMDLGIGANPAVVGGVNWSLVDYKNQLTQIDDAQASEEAWDELEKSIVASIARDVIVGIKKNTVNITIVTDVKEEN